MYTVSKAPSKLVAKTRRGGISQNLDTLRSDFKKSVEVETPEVLNGPRPVFHQINGRKVHSFQRSQPQDVISPQHEELIKFVHDAWTTVCNESESTSTDNGKSNGSRPPSVVFYEEDPNLSLKDFKPFDLESWWGKRLFNTITKSIP